MTPERNIWSYEFMTTQERIIVARTIFVNEVYTRCQYDMASLSKLHCAQEKFCRPEITINPQEMLSDPGKASILEDLVALSLERAGNDRDRRIMEARFGLLGGEFTNIDQIPHKINAPISHQGISSAIYRIYDRIKNGVGTASKINFFDALK